MQERREAAVFVAIGADAPHGVTFVERAAHLRRHPGQIGFPGGLVDADDGDDRTRTALRELHEELGVPPARVTVVATLPRLEVRRSELAITPVVGVLHARTPLRIDPAETAAVFTVPLAAIVAPGAVHRGVELVAGTAVDSWLFDHGDRHIWGLTARMLHDFVTAWNAPQSTLRRDVCALLNDGARHPSCAGDAR